MSIRAYRVIQLALAESSFSVSHDQKLVEFISRESGFYGYLNTFGSGEVDVPIDVLQKAVWKAQQLELDDVTVQRLKEDIAATKAKKDDSVSYSCF